MKCQFVKVMGQKMIHKMKQVICYLFIKDFIIDRERFVGDEDS